MKYSNTLKLNAVDEWRPYYINYAGLKRYVYKGADLQVDTGIPHYPRWFTCTPAELVCPPEPDWRHPTQRTRRP